MDKLRALRYFAAAADTGSFSLAARQLDVSVPAVSKLVGSLEKQLGTRLFERGAQGLSLTTEGQDYLEACLPALQQIDSADETLRGAAGRPRGTLVLGVTPHVALHVLTPALPRFHARYPDIDIDVRGLDRVSDVEPGVIDVFVLQGWPPQTDLVRRRVATSRLLTLASPRYWARHGVPAHPREMVRHTGLFLRNPQGTVLDLWEYERGGETVSVTVPGWLTSDNRDVITEAAVAGEGVTHSAAMTCADYLKSGRLVPVLTDWELKGGPPVSLLYRPNQRGKPRVRAFVDFATELFRNLEGGFETPQGVDDRPAWHQTRSRRASRHAGDA